MRLPTILVVLFAATSLAAQPRVVALDQCADQYVLALSPRAGIAQLSNRALNTDSYLRDAAKGLPRGRADTETVLAKHPDVVVRWWGGEPRLLADLNRRGVTVVRLEDAEDFAGVRRNVRVVAAALGQRPAGEWLIANMDRRLVASAGAWGGRGGLYLSSGGATAGRGTLIDAMMRAAGLTNLDASVGFHTVSLEGLVAHPPSAVVQGFFDAPEAGAASWGVGRHLVLRRLIAGRTLVSLPSAVLACPAWFAADGVELIARAAQRGPAFQFENRRLPRKSGGSDFLSGSKN